MPRGTLDDVWLPFIGQSDFVVITGDQRIRYRPVERQLWVEHRVRGFVLTGRGSQSTFESLAVLVRHWDDIRAAINQGPVGPWMVAVNVGGLRAIEL